MRALLFVLACTRTVPAPEPLSVPILEAALARPAPTRGQARFTIKLDARAWGIVGSTGGALILDRPRGHLAVMGPFGGPLVTAQTDGTGLAVALVRDRLHFVEPASDAIVRETTGGWLGLDQLLDVLVGRLPFAREAVSDAVARPDGDLELRVLGPEGTTATVVLDDLTATPVAVQVVGPTGVMLLDAHYGPFVPASDGGPLVPSELALALPGMSVALELRYRDWTFPETVPDVFGMSPPEGFATAPLALLGPSLALSAPAPAPTGP